MLHLFGLNKEIILLIIIIIIIIIIIFIIITRGQFIAWDATAIHTCASSYLHLTSQQPLEQRSKPLNANAE